MKIMGCARGVKIYRKIIYGILIINLSSCITFYSQKEIVGIDNEYKEIILSDNNVEFVYKLYLNISGKFDDDGDIEIEWGNGEYLKIIISNKNTKYVYQSDYYSNKIYIRIQSKNNKAKLKIIYCLM
jgi:hypothetical protein